ncbi:hypothetical protein Syun_002891 [Stephania yunnanensis]|uniref:Disease resistance R13L4/SHOC-2-like LRR domain-containing protein n=1 Tax=Stephania yunnanensis TaxID=152371 RepID=A0AAP0L264_9MAGN
MELHLDHFMSDGYTSATSAHEWLSVIASAELHHLQVLTLSRCKLGGSIGTSLLNLSSLSHLDLSHNYITYFPHQMFHLPNLKILDLSYNFNLIGPLPEFLPGTALQQLFLTYTNYIGRIPDSIGNLKQLTDLEVGNCGEVPSSFSNISRLEELDMSFNGFVGPLPSLKASCMTIARIHLSSNKFSGPIPSSYANNDLPNLTYLDLSNNQLNGTIPPSLFTLPSLQEMHLGQNKLIGILDVEAFPNSISSPLTWLDLSYNLLQGNIPKFISKFTSLERLDLRSNNFHGVVDPRMFASLKNLSLIDLSDNIMLLIDTSDLVITIPSLSEFAASSCNLSAVPRFLRYQPHLSSLNLSDNQIQGKMPDWLWTNLESVDLSNNSLVGFEDPFSNHSSSSMRYLHLSSNHFEGSVPIFPSSLETLDLSSNHFEGSLPNFPKGMDIISLSKNKFIGAIPLTICNSSWSRIDLSHNQISGEIPSCLFNGLMDPFYFSVVDLSKNKLQGMIPDTFGSECSLEGLNLNGNQLEGPLPRSLVNCRDLSVLDLGNNQIDDTFPFWLEHLESLQVLMLQTNKFHGPIRRRHIANSSFESLHIISLSANSFTGHLPLEYFPSLYLKGMYENDDHQTSHSSVSDVVMYTFLMFPNKGQALEYSSVQIPVLNAIDLSSNLFDGEIAASIGDYKSLMSLNLSHNSLVGKIPSSLANLRQLESLDLSNNDLMGEIPSELTSLTFISVFNVSRNHLIGMIPSGRQFDTFPSSSFEGNSRLCGIQLQIDCNPNKSGNVAPPSDHANQSNGTNFDWIFAVAGYGSGLVVGMDFLVLYSERILAMKLMDGISMNIAYVEKHKIMKLTRVKVNELLLWINLVEIYAEEPRPEWITFKIIGGLPMTFPASAFIIKTKEIKEHKEVGEAISVKE